MDVIKLIAPAFPSAAELLMKIIFESLPMFSMELNTVIAPSTELLIKVMFVLLPMFIVDEFTTIATLVFIIRLMLLKYSVPDNDEFLNRQCLSPI